MATRLSAVQIALSLSVGVASGGPMPALAAEARLVHCRAAGTCLRLSGHRAHAGVTVQVAGEDLRVEGERSWRADVPLAVARQWPGVARDRLIVTLADPRTGGRRSETALLPPGALAGHVELAEFVVHAH